MPYLLMYIQSSNTTNFLYLDKCILQSRIHGNYVCFKNEYNLEYTNVCIFINEYNLE